MHTALWGGARGWGRDDTDVLRGQAIRGNAGLYYTTYEEFSECLRTLYRDRVLRRTLGENGRAFFRRHYTWSVIDRKYLDMLEQLNTDEHAGATGQLEPMSGWLARRRRTVRPAGEIVAQLPTGPVLESRKSAS